MEPEVISEVRGSVAWITFNRPDRLNTMNRKLLELTLMALETHGEDPAVRVVVVTGAGRAFGAGGDLSEPLDAITGDGPLARQTSELRRLMRVSQLLFEMPKPTIAAVNGACAGASLGVACAADIRICAETAIFTSAFLGAGVSGDFAGSWGLARAIGPALARDMYLTGRRLDAAAALRMGLVSEVHPSSGLLARAEELALELASRPPLALAAMKRNFNSAESALLHQILEAEAANHVATTNTEDAAEARMAFLEKRRPLFKGR